MKLIVVLSVAIAMTLLACSKDSTSTGPGPALRDNDYLALGWQHFEAQRYDSAVTNFTSAYNLALTQAVRGEALNGRGWSSMYKRDLSRAKGDFSIAAGVTGIPTNVLNDVRVGNAFTLYSMNVFVDAASNAHAALTDNPSYTFSHDAKVTVKRVRLLLLQSYFANGQFAQAAAQLDLLDPARAPHSSEPPILLERIAAALNSL
ncbi:MAG: hypothetical protein HW389_565 [Bacteroidetes bacterium]|nr:hypothetical protein [Bacteroidota bacterium]